jgi:NAD(P)-dependent dehydrogenase (short-subunit alcohol dehydrogenase family)
MLAAYGRIDVLVNNVGVSGGVTPLTAIDMAEWSKTFDTNIMSAVLMTRHAIPPMIEQGRGSDRQHLVHCRFPVDGRDGLRCVESRDDPFHARHRRAARPTGHPRQRDCARPPLDADGEHRLG